MVAYATGVLENGFSACIVLACKRAARVCTACPTNPLAAAKMAQKSQERHSSLSSLRLSVSLWPIGPELPGCLNCWWTANSKLQASDADPEANASTKSNIQAFQVSDPSTNEHSSLAGLMDTSMSEIMSTWPQTETLSWDDTQLEVDWISHDPCHVDNRLASVDAFGDDGSAREEPDPPSPTQPPRPTSRCHPHTYAHGQPGGGALEKQDGSSRSNMNKSIESEGGGGGTMNMLRDKCMSWPSLVIAQLSQLSTRLSSLRYSSYTLAKAAELSSCRLPNGRQTPLIDTAAFDSVAAWLAYGHDSAHTNANPSLHAPAECGGHCPNPALETKATDGHGILHDVFSASDRLLETLRDLQAKNTVESFNSSAATSATTPSAAPSGQSSVYLGLTKGPWSGSQQHCNNTRQIIRHLVMACGTLLLEIYMAVLIALQHDAYHGISVNTTALGDVRLVLVVQLCSYFIDRQQQAVDLCLAPQTPLSPLSVNGRFPQKSDLSGSQQPNLPGLVLNTADIEVLSDLKSQVQQKLAHLRQTLRCT